MHTKSVLHQASIHIPSRHNKGSRQKREPKILDTPRTQIDTDKQRKAIEEYSL